MRLVEIICYPSFTDTLTSIARQQAVDDYWISQNTTDGRLSVKMLVKKEQVADLVDRLETLFDGSPKTNVLVHPVMTDQDPLEQPQRLSEQPAVDLLHNRAAMAQASPMSLPIWLAVLLVVSLPALGLGLALAKGNVWLAVIMLALAAVDLVFVSRWVAARMRLS